MGYGVWGMGYGGAAKRKIKRKGKSKAEAKRLVGVRWDKDEHRAEKLSCRGAR
jgi:hypothetical protein